MTVEPLSLPPSLSPAIILGNFTISNLSPPFPQITQFTATFTFTTVIPFKHLTTDSKAHVYKRALAYGISRCLPANPNADAEDFAYMHDQ